MRFGRYVLEERIGEGGMAEVFRARLDDGAFEKPVCIKRIRPSLAGEEGFADMLRDEARLAARLTHVNLVQALDFGSADGTLFMVMELVEGTTLAHVVRALRHRGDRLPVATALSIGILVCRGLDYAHKYQQGDKPLGFVHRDLSPQNILLGVDGAVKVGDFGVARASERLTKTMTGAIKGKPQYMAPEQAMAEACDHRVDQFATGIVLWEMLAGRDLFGRGSVVATFEAVTKGAVPSLVDERADVSESLDAVVKRALEKDRDARFADMRALEDALVDELERSAFSPADLDVRPFVAAARGDDDGLTVPRRRTRASSDTSDVFATARTAAAAAAVVTAADFDTARTLPGQPALKDTDVALPRPPLTPPAEPLTLPQAEAPPSSPPSSPPPSPPPSPTPLPAARTAPRLAMAALGGAAAALGLGALALAALPRATPPSVAAEEPALAVVSVDAGVDLAAVAAAAAPPPPPEEEAPQEPPASDPPAPAPRAVDVKLPRPRPLGEALREAKRAMLASDAETAVQVLAPYAHGSDAQVHRVLGLAYTKLKMGDLAREHYRRYLEIAPNAPDRDQIWKALAARAR